MSLFRPLLSGVLLTAPLWAQLPGIDGVPADGAFPAVNVAPQRILCSVSQQPLTVRAEGLAELLGDIVTTCTGNLKANPRNFIGVLPLNYNTAPQQVPTFNLGVTLSVPVTSRLLGDPFTEALLFIDDPNIPFVVADNPRSQSHCTLCSMFQHDGGTNAVGGVIGPGSATDPLAGSVTTSFTGKGVVNNIFVGARTNNQTITFRGLPLAFADTRGNPRLFAAYNAIKAANGGVYAGQPLTASITKTYRIKNLRGAIAGAASVNSQIFANVQIENPAGTLQLTSASAVVGQVLEGMRVERRNPFGGDSASFTSFNPTALVSCLTVNRDLAVDASDGDPFNGGNFAIRFTEGYGVAFRPRGFVESQPLSADQNQPDVNYNTESGFYNRNVLGLLGIADHGTRLRIVIDNVPANVRIYTSVAATQGTSPTIGGYAVVADATGLNTGSATQPAIPTALISSPLLPAGGLTNPGPGFAPFETTNQGLIHAPVTGGRMTQAWEIYGASPALIESINFVITVAYRSANNPGLGAATFRGTFAPVHTSAVAGGAAVPVPRFVDGGTSLEAFSISSCLTNLLFPFVTNQAGFNTGIALSNTSLTNPGTGELFSLDSNNGVAPQAGSCTLNYFGTTGADGASPPPATTGSIPAGRTFVMTLASGSSGPFGTVPAVPNFQGYLIAQCRFRYAHGYAFISDLGASQLAQGYLALVMDGQLIHRTGILSESLNN